MTQEEFLKIRITDDGKKRLKKACNHYMRWIRSDCNNCQYTHGAYHGLSLDVEYCERILYKHNYTIQKKIDLLEGHMLTRIKGRRKRPQNADNVMAIKHLQLWLKEIRRLRRIALSNQVKKEKPKAPVKPKTRYSVVRHEYCRTVRK